MCVYVCIVLFGNVLLDLFSLGNHRFVTVPRRILSLKEIIKHFTCEHESENVMNVKDYVRM